MQLHTFTTAKKDKRKKRIGRGGKRGTTSGRGQKGQKSRSGHRLRPAQRDLIIRLPKRRGFRNKPRSVRALTLNLADLNKLKAFFADGKRVAIINRKVLQELDLVPMGYSGPVKILGKGALAFKAEVRGIKMSKSAKKSLNK
ncbi:MAG: uL15 family ribosomal protein [bacterium]|nr:uL15 family ribosomal protein [bacterium]